MRQATPMVLLTIQSIAAHVLNSTEEPFELYPTVVTSTKSNSTVLPIVEIVLGTVTYLVIIAMTVVGNTLVVLAVFNYRPLKKVQNYFLVSLAASDLAVAIFVMPLHVVKFLAGGRWLLGTALCQVFTTSDILLCTSSILNLCAIAIDRYCAIHDPINYAQKRTPKFVCIVIAVVWVLSVLISLPPLIAWNDFHAQTEEVCVLSQEKVFVVYSASGSFFLPLLVMIVVYVKIFISARQRIRTNRGRSALMRINNPPPDRTDNKKSGKKGCGERTPLVQDAATVTVNGKGSGSDSSNGGTVDTTTKSMKYHQSSIRKSVKHADTTEDEENPTNVLRKREKISVAKEKRAAKTIAVIIFVFVFCWFPFFCTYVIMPFCESCYLHPKVDQAFVWLGYINSSLNPFLYGILNLEFRRAFKKILCPKAALAQRRRRLSGQP